MARGRLESQWEQTSWIVAMIHNVNCTKKSAAKEPDYFNPYRQRRRSAARPKNMGTVPLSTVADVFVRRLKAPGSPDTRAAS